MTTKDMLKKPEISFWLGLLIPMASILISWGALSQKIETIDELQKEQAVMNRVHIEEAENRFDRQDTKNAEILIRLAQIQKDIEFLVKSRAL